MITVELTEDHVELLTEGARRYGRIAIGLQTPEGDDVIIVLAQNHRRGRPAKPRVQRAGANLGEPPENGERAK